MKYTPLITILLLLAAPALRAADDLAREREQVLALGRLTAAPAVMPAEGFAAENGLKAIFYDALPWKGKPTKVFAWLGLPVTRQGKVPGIVLVHGGGGTAFKEWVTKWNEHGYAAISIAVEGQTDEPGAVSRDGRRGWKQHAWPGPARNGIYGDSEEPLVDQWMYHAVADTVLANSLLRGLPEVDPGKVGLMGISWGGVITSTAIGVDPRFAFAVPTYGCGHLFDSDNQYGRALGDSRLYREVWDPMVRMDRVRMPVLWFSWPEDSHFPLDCQAACYRTAPGPHMVALMPGMKHGHSPGWNPPDSYAFAESVVRNGRPWCVETAARVLGATVKVEFDAGRDLDRAVLVSTTDGGFTGNRQWSQSPAALERHGQTWIASAEVPPQTTAWFINVFSGDLVASSDYQERTE